MKRGPGIVAFQAQTSPAHLQTQVQAILTDTSSSRTSYGRKAWAMDWWAHMQRLPWSSSSEPPPWVTCMHWSTRRCNGGLGGARARPAGLDHSGRPLTVEPQKDATTTDLRRRSGASTRRVVTCGNIPRLAGLALQRHVAPFAWKLHNHTYMEAKHMSKFEPWRAINSSPYLHSQHIILGEKLNSWFSHTSGKQALNTNWKLA
jgi:hypothetical protein